MKLGTLLLRYRSICQKYVKHVDTIIKNSIELLFHIKLNKSKSTNGKLEGAVETSSDTSLTNSQPYVTQHSGEIFTESKRLEMTVYDESIASYINEEIEFSPSASKAKSKQGKYNEKLTIGATKILLKEHTRNLVNKYYKNVSSVAFNMVRLILSDPPIVPRLIHKNVISNIKTNLFTQTPLSSAKYTFEINIKAEGQPIVAKQGEVKNSIGFVSESLNLYDYSIAPIIDNDIEINSSILANHPKTNQGKYTESLEIIYEPTLTDSVSRKLDSIGFISVESDLALVNLDSVSEKLETDGITVTESDLSLTEGIPEKVTYGNYIDTSSSLILDSIQDDDNTVIKSSVDVDSIIELSKTTWEYPIYNEGMLTITQVYSAKQTNNILEVS